MDRRNLTFFINFIIIMFIKKCSSQQIEEENICQKYPGNLLIPNPNDCNSFYACQHGNAMKIICPNDSAFNPKLGNCDPDYHDCVIDEQHDGSLHNLTDYMELLAEDINGADETETLSTTDTTVTDFSTSTTLTPISSSTVPPDTTSIISSSTSAEEIPECEKDSQHVPSNPCPSNDTNDPSFLASESFCDSFYLCYHGRPYEMFCPMGFSWNQENKKCILERESTCTDFSGNKVPKCPSDGQHFIPHSERCNLFYYCENGTRSIQQCTAFKHWDVVEQTCKLDIRATCIKMIPRSQRAKYFLL